MKKIIKSIATITLAAMLPASVYGAGITLKGFDVSGGSIDVSGAVETEGKQVSLTISSQSKTEGIYQSISGPDGNFVFDIDSDESWTGSYTATINSEDGETASVTFSGDGSYVSYTEPVEPISETREMEMSGVAYGNRIHISGSTQNPEDLNEVTLVIYKQTAGVKIEKEDIAYIDQTQADTDGNFSFDFGLQDDIRYYTAACFSGGKNISDSVRIAKTASEYVVADVTAEVLTQSGVNMATMSASLENLGFEASDYIMIITVYDINGMLIDVVQSDKKTIDAGAAISDNIVLEAIPKDAETVKAMLWSVGETLIPLDSAVTINL